VQPVQVDQMAGAGTIAPAAAPETDLRKSRRFIGCSSTKEIGSGTSFARFVPRLNDWLTDG